MRDRYQLVGRLGSSGKGEVWKAVDRQHGRHVALKIRPAGDESEREALLEEVRILLSLRPHAALSLVRDDFFVSPTAALDAAP